MPYFPTKKLEYASGYVWINTDGTYCMDEQAPDDVKKRFEKDWPKRLKEVDELRKKGYIIPYSL